MPVSLYVNPDEQYYFGITLHQQIQNIISSITNINFVSFNKKCLISHVKFLLHHVFTFKSMNYALSWTLNHLQFQLNGSSLLTYVHSNLFFMYLIISFNFITYFLDIFHNFLSIQILCSKIDFFVLTLFLF